ncbi:H-NS histone family protein [Burkholderia multivorans]|uniref:H-NS histone family protein n=1 Tax=Burkholderia multivorans TaxID=87883 RepID=UPI002ED067E6|nr:H-NS histone family protein [Burkholderia multivorans]
MPELSELLKRKAEIDAQIQSAQAEAREAGIKTVTALADELGESFALEVIKLLNERFNFQRKTGKRRKTSKMLQKYRDPSTGKTWNGRGRLPRWLAGHEAEYAIQPETDPRQRQLAIDTATSE